MYSLESMFGSTIVLKRISVKQKELYNFIKIPLVSEDCSLPLKLNLCTCKVKSLILKITVNYVLDIEY